MLFIVFQLGDDRYALNGRELVEVLPLMTVKRLPHAPAGIAGMLDYHGVPLPVVDLSSLALGRPAADRISTRILIAEGRDGRRLALIAERANEMLTREPADFNDSGVTISDAPYLGPVTRDARGIVQWITPERLLSPEVRDALFHQVEEAA
jgi:chemotaxis-related protein WspB